MARINARYLLLAAGALFLGAPAFSATAVALGPGAVITPDLNSRACGLVLLSSGRETIRAAKEPLKWGAPANTAKYAEGIAQLVRASLLLTDGRGLADKSAARKLAANAAPLGGPTRAGAIESCEKWIIQRAGAVDFDRSDGAVADAVAFAQMTAESEP